MGSWNGSACLVGEPPALIECLTRVAEYGPLVRELTGTRALMINQSNAAVDYSWKWTNEIKGRADDKKAATTIFIIGGAGCVLGILAAFLIGRLGT